MPKIHLQGLYGDLPAVPAGEIKKGDVLVWNFGYKSTVLEVIKRTKAQIILLLKSNDSGNTAERRLGINRLVVREEK